jgi:hypothetical protein
VKLIVYIRNRATDSARLEQARTRAQSWADKHGFTIAAEFMDSGANAYKPDWYVPCERPGKAAAIAAVTSMGASDLFTFCLEDDPAWSYGFPLGR